MKYDYSTIKQEELKRLPVARIAPSYYLQERPGNGCFLDPPGYPTYFTQSVYTSHGNQPARGAQTVICGRVVEHSNDYDSKKTWDEIIKLRDKRLQGLWNPLPIDHPRTRAWIVAVYIHLNHCYHDESATDKSDQTLIFPVPYYKLKSFTDDPRFSDEWRQMEIAAVKQANEDIMRHAQQVAVPDNHMAVRLIRRFYPEYQPELDMIAHPPETRGTWYERYAERPAPENCPGDMGMKHPMNESWCQLCGDRKGEA